MNAIAERWSGQGVGSIFLYTHEAPPGEHWPHLTSFEQKLRHARALRDELGVTRPILVDALDGSCHRAYGGMPMLAPARFTMTVSAVISELHPAPVRASQVSARAPGGKFVAVPGSRLSKISS